LIDVYIVLYKNVSSHCKTECNFNTVISQVPTEEMMFNEHIADASFYESVVLFPDFLGTFWQFSIL